jgi:hypothetical protein
MEKENVLFVRLKKIIKNSPMVQPREYRIFNNRTGKMMVFTKPGVWVKILDVDKPLLENKQWQDRPGSPFVFDICTEEQARRIDLIDKQKREAKRIVIEPSVDTADDMTGGDMRSADLSIHKAKKAKANLLNVNALPFEVNDLLKDEDFEDGIEEDEENLEEVNLKTEQKVVKPKPKRRPGRPRKKK